MEVVQDEPERLGQLLERASDGRERAALTSRDGQAGEHDSIAIDVEWLIGGKNADVLQGGPRVDRLEGAEGNDVLNGWNANDLLVGGPGRDLLRGGSGADRLNSKDRERDEVYGGKGRDRARSDGLDLVAQVEGVF